MLQGILERKTDRGFGVIQIDGEPDLFFNSSALNMTHFEVLLEGQRVSFSVKVGARGVRAEDVVVP